MQLPSYSIDVAGRVPTDTVTSERFGPESESVACKIAIQSPFPFLGESSALACICDGFGEHGHEIAVFTANLVTETVRKTCSALTKAISPSTIPRYPVTLDRPLDATVLRFFSHVMLAVFSSLRDAVTQHFGERASKDGCSVILSLSIPAPSVTLIVTASAGDAASVVINRPEDPAAPVTVHTLARPHRPRGAEADRIVAAGGDTQDDLLFSDELGCALDVSRAIGADGFRPALISDPHVSAHVAPAHSLLVNYTAGIGTVLTPAEVVEAVLRREHSSREASVAVVRTAWKRWMSRSRGRRHAEGPPKDGGEGEGAAPAAASAPPQRTSDLCAIATHILPCAPHREPDAAGAGTDVARAAHASVHTSSETVGEPGALTSGNSTMAPATAAAAAIMTSASSSKVTTSSDAMLAPQRRRARPGGKDRTNIFTGVEAGHAKRARSGWVVGSDAVKEGGVSAESPTASSARASH